MIEEYWQRSVYLSFLDVAFNTMKAHFSQESRPHYERCWFIPKLLLSMMKIRYGNENKIYEK